MPTQIILASALRYIARKWLDLNCCEVMTTFLEAIKLRCPATVPVDLVKHVQD